MAQPESVHPVDKHVGDRVRARRKDIKISQQELGERLGLTFQQVQKYERGTNRISASKLYETSKILGVPIEWFFMGLDENTAGERDFSSIDPFAGLDKDQRRAIESLIKTMSRKG